MALSVSRFSIKKASSMKRNLNNFYTKHKQVIIYEYNRFKMQVFSKAIALLLTDTHLTIGDEVDRFRARGEPA